MYSQLFFGATCAGILLAAGLMPLPDREALPDLTLPEIELSDLTLPSGAELLDNFSAFVDDLPELGSKVDETVIRPTVQAVSQVARGALPERDAVKTVEVAEDQPTQMVSTVNFELDARDLDADAKAALNAFVASLNRDNSARLGIFGHTDLTGASGYNQALGQKRAETVAQYLLSMGVPSERIEIIKSYGETAPLIATDEPSRDNRRVQIKIM